MWYSRLPQGQFFRLLVDFSCESPKDKLDQLFTDVDLLEELGAVASANAARVAKTDVLVWSVESSGSALITVKEEMSHKVI